MLAHRIASSALCGQVLRRLASTTTAVPIKSFGTPSKVLSPESITLSEPGENQVQVSMIASPITIFDLCSVEGSLPCAPVNSVAGLEGAGRVTKVGSNVTDLSVNDAVVFVKPTSGTWAKDVVVDATSLYKIPSSFDVELAAGMVGAPSIAYRLLRDFASLNPGDVVLQNAANTAVGQCVIQMCKEMGVKTVNVIPESSEYENDYRTLETIGADIVCKESYIGTPAFKRLLSDLPSPKLALDGMGGIVGTNLARSLKCAPMVSYANLSRSALTIPVSLLISKNVSIQGFNLYKWLNRASQNDVNDMMNNISSLISADKLRVFLKKDKFSQFNDALAAATEPLNSRTILMMMQE